MTNKPTAAGSEEPKPVVSKSGDKQWDTDTHEMARNIALYVSDAHKRGEFPAGDARKLHYFMCAALTTPFPFELAAPVPVERTQDEPKRQHLFLPPRDRQGISLTPYCIVCGLKKEEHASYPAKPTAAGSEEPLRESIAAEYFDCGYGRLTNSQRETIDHRVAEVEAAPVASQAPALEEVESKYRYEAFNRMERELYESRERVRELESALIRLRDCDWVITPADRMDAVRDIARTALEGQP